LFFLSNPQLSKRQSEPLDELSEIVEAYIDDPHTWPLEEDQVDRLTLQTVMALLDHRLAAGEYRSAIISGLAVMGIRKDGGWTGVLDYTPIYSAVIKIARAMVVYQSYVGETGRSGPVEAGQDRRAAARGRVVG
jgi:hypothetical protein